jgi:hypothetical protein
VIDTNYLELAAHVIPKWLKENRNANVSVNMPGIKTSGPVSELDHLRIRRALDNAFPEDTSHYWRLRFSLRYTETRDLHDNLVSVIVTWLDAEEEE